MDTGEKSFTTHLVTEVADACVDVRGRQVLKFAKEKGFNTSPCITTAYYMPPRLAGKDLLFIILGVKSNISHSRSWTVLMSGTNSIK